jgi:lysozyme
VKTWSLMWAAKFVAKWEGFLEHAYLDTIAVPAVWTVAFGHTGKDVHAGMVVSRAEGLRLLAHDLRMAARAVKEGIHVKLAVRQRMALISLAFNCGAGAVVGSTLAAKINAHAKDASDCFLEWDHAGGVVVEGLLNRRRAEKWMFDHPKKRAKHNPHRPPNRKDHHR